MKVVFLRCFFISLIFGLLIPASFSQIWTENFNSYADGTINAPPFWTSVATDCDDGGNLNLGSGQSQWGVWGGQFTVNDIEGAPCCPVSGGGGNDNYWLSQSINISSYCNVSISLNVQAVGTFECDSPAMPVFGCTGAPIPDNSHDQVVAYYSLNGGPFQQFGYVCGSNGTGVLSIAGLNGATLQIKVSSANKANAEFYNFDNVVVNGTAFITPTISGIPATICQTASSIALPTTQSGITGNWSGMGVSANNFNPSGLSGNITLTFTPNPGQCANPATTSITVNVPVTPTISGIPASICENASPIALPTNQSGIPGNWSGSGVSANSFNPSGLSGNITLTFTPNAGQCANVATTIIAVNIPVTPTITGIPSNLCESASSIALPTTQSGITGNWSGSGVSANNFNPSGLSGNIILTFTPDAGQCANTTTTTITVDTPVTPTISGIPSMLCQIANPIGLPTNQSGISGNWSGNGVSSNNFDPSGLSGNIILTFTPDAGQCANLATTSITVNIPVTPTITGVPASICENAVPISLPTTQNGITGNWSGNGVSSNNFDPSGLSGNILLTFTPNAGECANVATTNIMVNTPVTPTITGVPASLCENASPIALPTNLGGIIGNWSGNGVSANNFDPSGLSGNITLTFTPNAGQCATTASTVITVNTPVTPTIMGIPANLCETAAPIALPTNQSGIMGNWSGQGVAANNFNPTGLSGNIILTFTPNAGQCANIVTTTIQVNQVMTPTITGIPASLCETASPIALPTNQSGITGNWSGNGVTANSFNPSGLSGNILLTFTPNAGQCANIATTNITVNTPVVPAITGVPSSLCESGNPVSLPTTQSGITGNWSGQGVSSNIFDPFGLNGSIILTFTPNPGQCAEPASTSVMVNTAPSFTNLTEICDPFTQTYTVSFDISGGNPLTYTVDGIPVGGSSYTSAPIDSGTPYSFNLDDGNGCGPIVISGSANCSCATSAGTMDFGNTPFHICDSTGFTVIANGNHLLDGDDVLEFILHTDPGAQLGTVIAISPSSTFVYPGNIVLGQTYYVSAVAGNNNGSGGVDLNDPCLSVSQGVPVIFYVPVVVISAGGTICDNDCFDFQVQFSGYSPFSLNYSVNTGFNIFTELLTSSASVTTFTICPSTYGSNNGQIQVYPTNITDINCSSDYLVPVVQTIIILPDAVNNLSPVLCEGQAVVVNGTVYNQLNPTGVEILTNAGANGCDSTININLSFYPPAIFNLTQTLCTGGSLTVNGTLYNQANPSGTEILQNASVHGCDSTVNINLSFNNSVTFNLSQTVCPGGSILVNGTTYDAAHPVGTETFVGGSYLGCDSIVNVNLTFYSPAVTNLNQTLCTGGSLIVNGTLYNQSNPTGTEILNNASVHGCDSMINVNLSFNNIVTFNLNQTLCPGENIIVNGTLYDAAHPAGSETFIGGSYLGCDSVVNVNLSFYLPALFNLAQTLCTGGSILVNGTLYNQTNPNGTEILLNAGLHGCDSIVNVSLSFINNVTYSLSQTLCPGGSIIINGSTYNEVNPTGSETFTGGSHTGCDSTVNINLSFYPPAIFSLDSTLQQGQTIVVNGTVYGQSNPAGTEIITAGSIHGCDSTVVIKLMFANAFIINYTIGAPCSDGRLGTIYVDPPVGGVAPFIYKLDQFTSLPHERVPAAFTGWGTGNHLLTVIDGAGAKVEILIFVPDPLNLLLDLGPDLTIPYGGSVMLSAQSNFQPVNWLWTPSTFLDCTDCEHPTSIVPTNDITYTLVAYDSTGCTATDIITIFVTQVYDILVPTVFSPNGDGINDMVFVSGAGQVLQIKSFLIFDRWGNQMYEAVEFMADDVTKGWDGTFKGQSMGPGVYVWIAEVEFVDGKKEKFKGELTLIR